MQVSLETTSGLERRLTIVVPAADVDAKVEERLKEMSRRVRLDGFRPGKVPFKVVKKRYGKGAYQEVLGEVMQTSYMEAISSEELQPAGSPSVEPKVMEEGKDFEFIATFEVYPEIALEDFAQIKVEKPVSTVQDADVDTMLSTLREQSRTWEVVERAAESGDQVEIDYVGTLDGEAFEGGSAENQKLVLGSGQMISGFEDGLVGASAGEEKVLELTFPEDYHSEELKGKQTAFTVKVKSVSQPVLPEMNDEFFAKYGVKEGGEEAFREEIRKNMERELRQAVKTKIKNQVMDGLLSVHNLDVPQALAGQEIDRLRHQAVAQFGGANSGIDPKNLPAELFKDEADKRVKLGLLVGEIVKVKEIKVDDNRVRSMIEDIASAYQQPQQVIDWYYSNEQQLSQVQYVVLEEQVVDTILDAAQVSEAECSYEEAIKPAQQHAAEEEAEA